MSVPKKEEIKKRYNDREKRDFFGFEVKEYLQYTDWDFMKDKVKDGLEEKDLGKFFMEIDKNSILKQIEDYMSFAWDKANGYRGISSSRSICHFIGWIWLSGAKDFALEIELDFENNYEYYGKDILVKICKYYKIDHSKWDDGIRVNNEY